MENEQQKDMEHVGIRYQEPLRTYRYDGHAIAALVLGIIAVIMPMQAFGLGSFVAIALAIIALFQASASLKVELNPMARTGKILAIIALVLAVISLVALLLFTLGMTGMMHYNFQPARSIPRLMYMHRFRF